MTVLKMIIFSIPEILVKILPFVVPLFVLKENTLDPSVKTSMMPC